MITGGAAQTQLDPAWLEEFIGRWAEGWNSHDPERLLALMTEDITYEDSAWPTVMHGHQDVRRFLDSIWTAMPDLRFEAVDGPFIKPGAPAAAFYWRGTGRFTGRLDPPGFAPTGKPLEFFGADFHEYRDGRVAHLRIVFDNMDVARKLGLLPQAGSRADRAGATAQRLAMRVRSLRRP
jgi:steroid delta-isomerase-like uncharacterized protein